MKPALQELVRLLAKKAVEEHLNEAMEQQGARTDDACPTSSVDAFLNERQRRTTSDQHNGRRKNDRNT